MVIVQRFNDNIISLQHYDLNEKGNSVRVSDLYTYKINNLSFNYNFEQIDVNSRIYDNYKFYEKDENNHYISNINIVENMDSLDYEVNNETLFELEHDFDCKYDKIITMTGKIIFYKNKNTLKIVKCNCKNKKIEKNHN